MTQGKGSSRKTQRVVRVPASKFGHLQKKTRQIREPIRTLGKKHKP